MDTAVETLRPLGRAGATIFALAAVERLRGLLEHVPSGSPALIAGTALTELWRVLEGLLRPDPKRLNELSQACWVLVEIEPAEKVPAAFLEALVAATHHALEAYLKGKPEEAMAAAKKAREPLGAAEEEERARQERDLALVAQALREGRPAAQVAQETRERAEKDGQALVKAVLAELAR